MPLRYYQTEAIDALFSYFQTNDGNPIIAHPTGTGKSHVIAGFVQKALAWWPNQRFVMLTHVKELIEQNADKLVQAWPDAPLGICSAGLKQRELNAPIVFGGVATVVNEVDALGWRDLLFIDECHLLSPKENTRYQTIIAGLRRFNPRLKVIGLTATPFRSGQGMLTESTDENPAIFTHIAHDMTRLDAFDRLIAEGFLSAPIPRTTKTALDTTGVKLVNGDFNAAQLQKAVDKTEITNAALTELVQHGKDRQSWLIFASGIQHAEHIADTLSMWGYPCAAIHSKMDDKKRDFALDAFKAGHLRAIANNNILTTGFDHPPVDCIGMLRPTASASLWVQMIGRGTRPSPETGKRNCLVLDYARNTQRLGPINDPQIPNPKGKTKGTIPVKICEVCGVYNHTRAPVCIACGNPFEFVVKITEGASDAPLLANAQPEINAFDVERVIYAKHAAKKSGRVGIRVMYFCGLRMFEEYVFLEDPGFLGHKARDWWRQRHRDEPPPTTEAALQMTTWLRSPRRIHVWTNKQFPEVLRYDW